MSEKRILITYCSSDCRNLHILKEPVEDLEPGHYCSAYIHGSWEKIDPKQCKTCTREKYLSGIPVHEALQKGAYAIAKKRFGKHADAIQMSNALGWTECEDYAQAVIESLVEK